PLGGWGTPAGGPSSARGSSSRVRAAASSIASGRPSRRRQISTTAAAFSRVRAKPGRTARARSTNSVTAGEAVSSATGAASALAGSCRRSRRVPPCGPRPQPRAAGGKNRHATTAAQQLIEVTAGLDHLLQVVEDEQPRIVAEKLDEELERFRPRHVAPDRPANAGQDQPR